MSIPKEPEAKDYRPNSLSLHGEYSLSREASASKTGPGFLLPGDQTSAIQEIMATAILPVLERFSDMEIEKISVEANGGSTRYQAFGDKHTHIVRQDFAWYVKLRPTMEGTFYKT